MKVITLQKNKETSHLPFMSSRDISNIDFEHSFTFVEVYGVKALKALISTIDVGEFCLVYGKLPGFIRSINWDECIASVFCSDGSEVVCSLTNIMAVCLLTNNSEVYVGGTSYIVSDIDDENYITVTEEANRSNEKVISYSEIDFPVFGMKVFKVGAYYDGSDVVAWVCGACGRFYIVYNPFKENFGHSGVYNYKTNGFFFLTSWGLSIFDCPENDLNLVESRNLFLKNLAV